MNDCVDNINNIDNNIDNINNIDNNIVDIYNKFNPFSLFQYYLSYKFFTTSHKFLNKMVDKNLANYGNAFIHSTSFCLFSFLYFILENSKEVKLFSTFWDFIKVYSSGYFIYDFLYIVKHQKINMVNFVLLYHHLSSINLLRDNELSKYVFKMVLFAEISNFPSPIVYYLIKSKTKNKAFLFFMKKMQFVLYSFFRIPLIGYYMISVFKKYPYNKKLYISLPVYLMGIVWTSKLYKGLSK